MISIVVKLEPYEAEELFQSGGSSSKPAPETVPSETTVSKALAEEDETVILTERRDNPEDFDYIPSEEEEARPKAFDAMKLVSAKKRQARPFAPPERHAKKKSGSSSRYVAFLE